MPKLAAIEFRVFLVMDNTVARQAIAENGRKWQKIEVRLKRRHLPKMAGNGFPRVSRRGHRGSQEDHGQNDKNSRKWWKIDFRGYLVGNGFPRVSRHSPTTSFI